MAQPVINMQPDGVTPAFLASLFAVVKATSGNQANALASATLPAVPGKTAVLTGIMISAGPATVAIDVLGTITDGIAPMSFVFGVQGVAAGPPTNLNLQNIAWTASAPNTAITVSIPALGAGNAFTVVNIFGTYI